MRGMEKGENGLQDEGYKSQGEEVKPIRGGAK